MSEDEQSETGFIRGNRKEVVQVFKTGNMRVRVPMYFIGLFVMTIGIAVSVKSNLGVSPVSSLPYTITCVWGMEMGRATIVFHIGLVIIQLLILRRNFKPVNLLQVLVGIVFGKFTTFCNFLMTFLPDVDNIPIRIVMSLVSAAFVAGGIFLYLPANLIPLAGEGAIQAVADVTKIEFPKVKVAFDVSMVTISVITCVLMIHSLGSVGVGTIISAFLVGIILGQMNRLWGDKRDRLLGVDRLSRMRQVQENAKSENMQNKS